MPNPTDTGVYLTLPPDLLAAVRELAAKNGRPFKTEVEHALMRHLAVPPILVVPVLPPATVPVEPEQPRGRGRPRKSPQ